MYLLMLLATFMSAIYGYNLSARPEYDRDIVRKKALAVMNRFNEQYRYAEVLMARVSDSTHEDYEPLFVLPGDVIMGGKDNTDPNNKYLLIYKQNHELAKEEYKFYQKKIAGEEGSADYMPVGRKLYPGDEMATKIVCLENKLYCSTGSEYKCTGKAESCEVTVDASDPANKVISGTCCKGGGASGGKYLVTFKTLDAKWLSRITGKTSVDFMKSLQTKEYNQNIGIINWEKGAWKFQGKLRFLPAYEEEKLKWDDAHSDSQYFPSDKKNMTSWVLPEFFDEEFFVVDGINLCEKGCLFHIDEFL